MYICFANESWWLGWSRPAEPLESPPSFLYCLCSCPVWAQNPHTHRKTFGFVARFPVLHLKLASEARSYCANCGIHSVHDGMLYPYLNQLWKARFNEYVPAIRYVQSVFSSIFFTDRNYRKRWCTMCLMRSSLLQYRLPFCAYSSQGSSMNLSCRFTKGARQGILE